MLKIKEERVKNSEPMDFHPTTRLVDTIRFKNGEIKIYFFLKANNYYFYFIYVSPIGEKLTSHVYTSKQACVQCIINFAEWGLEERIPSKARKKLFLLD